MKWIYGTQDFKTLERCQENCYLLTNGLGGYSSMTMAGSAARNDHAFLMACIKAPNHRYNMVHRLRESVRVMGEAGVKSHDEVREAEYVLSSQEFADGNQETGYEYLTAFTYEDTPVWKYKAQGIEIRKEAGMGQGKNTAAVCYEIRNQGRKKCILSVIPFFQFMPKGGNGKMKRIQRHGNRVENGELVLYFRTNGQVANITKQEETYYYSYDACDGRQENGRAMADHEITIETEPGRTNNLEIIYEMEPGEESAREIISQLKASRRKLAERAGFENCLAGVLSKSAAQFLSKRASTGGNTILAGFPFFEDWGRDTMIALPGLCITTGQYDAAKSILRTFAVHEKKGLMPNLFPEGGSAPMYNTVDAALLFINCIYLYDEAVKDRDFVREMYPVMQRIVEHYKKGTDYAIHMDGDGLICAGEGMSQVTWMDVRTGDILPTPRHGKPVEVNAYWYNALCVMDYFSHLLGKEEEQYGSLARKVKEAFVEQFWLEEAGYLKDLISDTAKDVQIRCNQIWAVSMPFTMLDRYRERLIVETVFEKLYTPYGLRTLAPEDEEFHPDYGGPMLKRDLAYHQGTVWTFPLGGYYLAYLKVNDESLKAAEVVEEQLEVLESAMREGCIGQLPEIYDGGRPTSSRGCFAQAWSVGEILRAYKKVEEIKEAGSKV